MRPGEEHHVAKVLIAELEKMDGRGDHFDAKSENASAKKQQLLARA